MKLDTAAPVLLSSNLHRTAEWYERALGFETELYGKPPNFGIARRDDARIMFALCDRAAAIVPNWRIVETIWNAYVLVEDVDAYHEEVRRRGVVPEHQLEDAPWGMREFGVRDPDGYDIAFGTPLGA